MRDLQYPPEKDIVVATNNPESDRIVLMNFGDDKVVLLITKNDDIGMRKPRGNIVLNRKERKRLIVALIKTL